MSAPVFYLISPIHDRREAVYLAVTEIDADTYKGDIASYGIDGAIRRDMDALIDTGLLFKSESEARLEASVTNIHVHAVTEVDWERALVDVGIVEGRPTAFRVVRNLARLVPPPEGVPVLVLSPGADPFVANYEKWDRDVWVSRAHIQALKQDDQWVDITELTKEAVA